MELFAVASADNGLQWGEPTNITNSVDIDDRYPYVSPWNESGKVNVFYQADNVAGANAFNDGAPIGQPDYLFLKIDTPPTDPYEPPNKVKTQTLGGVPAQYDLGQNYPNPFNPTTAIEFALSADSQVRLTVFNTLGQAVATLVDGQMPAGNHRE